MSLFFKPRRREVRAVYTQPTVYGSGSSSYVDVDVSMSSMESSLQSIAVRTTVDLIASLTSELPVDVFTGKGADRREIPAPGYLEDPAGDGHGRQDWLYQVLISWLLRGNMFGDVLDRGPGNFPRQVDLFHPDHINGRLEDGRVRWTMDGKPVPDERMWHRRVNPVPGIVQGMSPVQAHAADIGLNIILTRFGLQYFRDGAHPGAVLTNTEKEIGDERIARRVKDRFMASVRGSREPAVLGKGWKYEAITINPEESQFLETRGFSAAECAHIFGPGFAELLGYQQAGSSLTYANISDRDLHIAKYALGKWLRRADRLLTEMLPRPQVARLNRDALLETTTMERYRAYALALAGKWKTINDVRGKEDGLDPVPWGNVPEGMAPADDADGGESPEALSEIIQKIYLGVGVVVTDEEARRILNDAGAGLAPGPLPPQQDAVEDEEGPSQ